MTALKDFKTAKHDGPGTTTTLSITCPSVVAGDILFVGVLVGAVTSTTLTIDDTFDDSFSQNLTSGADPMYGWWKIADGGEPASFTITLNVAKRAIAAVAASWDKDLLTPAPAAPASEVEAADFSVPLFANTTRNRLGILFLGKILTNTRTGTGTWAATGWTEVADEYAYGQPAVGAGDVGLESHVALFEVYDSDDIAAVTPTLNGVSTGVRGYIQLFYAVGEHQETDGGFFKLPRRRFYFHDLPYDLRTLRLLGDDL